MSSSKSGNDASKKELLCITLEIIFIAMNRSQAETVDCHIQIDNVTNEMIENWKVKLNSYLIGTSHCPIRTTLQSLVEAYAEKQLFVADKITLIKSLQLVKGLPQSSNKDDEMENLMLEIVNHYYLVTEEGEAYLRKYSEFLLSGTKEANNALRVHIAYDGLLEKRQKKMSLPEERHVIGAIVDEAIEFVDTNYNQYIQHKETTIELKSFLKGVSRLSTYLKYHEDQNASDEEFNNEDDEEFNNEEKRALCELYRLYEDGAMDMLQDLIEQGEKEQIEQAFGYEIDCSNGEDTWIRNSYIEYCLAHNVPIGKISLSIADGNHRLQAFANKGRSCVCDSNTVKKALAIFSGYCSFCVEGYLKFMFFGEGNEHAFRPILWNGSLPLLRYCLQELNSTFFGDTRLANGAWDVVCHNFVYGKDESFKPENIKCLTRKGLTADMKEFERKLIDAGIKKTVPES